MSDLNLVALTGRIGRDPEVRYTAGGTPVANTRLAVSKRRKGKDGERQDDTAWVTLVFWDKLAELAAQYAPKGTQIAIRGELQVRAYEDKTGAKRESTEVRVHDLTLLGGGKERSEEPRHRPNGDKPAADFDDDIPF